MDAARMAVRNATEQGLLGRPWEDMQGTTPQLFGQEAKPVAQLPTDAHIFRHANGMTAAFDVGGTYLLYSIDWWDGSIQWDEGQVQNVDEELWNRIKAGSIEGGNAAELGNVRSTFGSFQSFWDSILGQTIGYTNPARDDPGVRKVLAEFAARPDMTEAELQNKLRATDWWNTRSQAQLEWNGLAEGEKSVRRSDMSGRMEAAWMQYTGEADMAMSNPAWSDWLEKLTSGEQSFTWWVENVAKPTALQNGESPWSRTIRDETETQRQRPIDIENSSSKVRDLLTRWGLKWDDATLQTWGRNLVEKVWSDQDLLEEVKNQSQVLFPWKDREMETMTAAQPWLQTYNRVMEREGSLETSEVMGALQRGVTAWDFERELKNTSAWAGTANGQQAMYDTVSELGKRMGYE
jgi:hypothetical protein